MIRHYAEISFRQLPAKPFNRCNDKPGVAFANLRGKFGVVKFAASRSLGDDLADLIVDRHANSFQ